MILYLDLSDGVSGDMLVAALLDLAGAVPGKKGPLERVVRPALKAAGIDPRLVRIEAKTSGGIDALAFRVADAPGFATFDELIMAMYASGIDANVADEVAAVAQRMAAAESEVHGTSEVHLHELSGLDTAVDLISAAVLVHHLAPERVVASPPALGDGVVHTAHGELPVPAPAVVALLRGLPVTEEPAGAEHRVGELTTPTGAALVAHFVRAFGPPPEGDVIGVGFGAGARALLHRPNVLRAALIDPAAPGKGAPQAAPVANEDARDAPQATPVTMEDAPDDEGAAPTADEAAGDDRQAATAANEDTDDAGPAEPAGEAERTTDMAHDLPQDGNDDRAPDERPRDGDGPVKLPDEHYLLETNVDDMSPELFAHAAEVLREAGAADVWATPAYMKKGRPGMILHVLAAPAACDRLVAAIFAETSTFGLRVLPVGRIYADERRATVTIAGKDIGVRMAFVGGRLVTVSPEFEDVRGVAAAVGRPAKVVYEAAQAAARNRFSTG
jgi:uncharacterized protein (DUF111 family)